MPAHAGWDHHNARLPDRSIREMREIYERWKASGDSRGYKSLGDIFGVSCWTVRDIVKNRTRSEA